MNSMAVPKDSALLGRRSRSPTVVLVSLVVTLATTMLACGAPPGDITDSIDAVAPKVVEIRIESGPQSSAKISDIDILLMVGGKSGDLRMPDAVARAAPVVHELLSQHTGADPNVRLAVLPTKPDRKPVILRSEYANPVFSGSRWLVGECAPDGSCTFGDKVSSSTAGRSTGICRLDETRELECKGELPSYCVVPCHTPHDCKSFGWTYDTCVENLHESDPPFVCGRSNWHSCPPLEGPILRWSRDQVTLDRLSCMVLRNTVGSLAGAWNRTYGHLIDSLTEGTGGVADFRFGRDGRALAILAVPTSDDRSLRACYPTAAAMDREELARTCVSPEELNKCVHSEGLVEASDVARRIEAHVGDSGVYFAAVVGDVPPVAGQELSEARKAIEQCSCTEEPITTGLACWNIDGGVSLGTRHRKLVEEFGANGWAFNLCDEGRLTPASGEQEPVILGPNGLTLLVGPPEPLNPIAGPMRRFFGLLLTRTLRYCIPATLMDEAIAIPSDSDTKNAVAAPAPRLALTYRHDAGGETQILPAAEGLPKPLEFMVKGEPDRCPSGWALVFGAILEGPATLTLERLP